jgi:flagellar biosynthesis GTPase FlhF
MCPACSDPQVKKNLARIARKKARDPARPIARPRKTKKLLLRLGITAPCQRRMTDRTKCKVPQNKHGNPHSNGCKGWLGISPREERRLAVEARKAERAEKKKEKEKSQRVARRVRANLKDRLKAERLKEMATKKKTTKKTKKAKKKTAKKKTTKKNKKKVAKKTARKKTKKKTTKKAAKKVTKKVTKKTKRGGKKKKTMKGWFRKQLEKGTLHRKKVLADALRLWGEGGLRDARTYLSRCKRKGNEFGVLLKEVLVKV